MRNDTKWLEAIKALARKSTTRRGSGAPQRHHLIGHAWTEICLWLKPLKIQIPEMTDD